MMNSARKILGAAVALAALACAPLAQAKLVTFDIKWANETGANIASAVMTLDSGFIHTGGYGAPGISMSNIQNFTLTVSGASVGNGVFGKSDFSGISFYAKSPLDLGHELIGQPVMVQYGGVSTPFGYGDADGATGAFDLWAYSATTPHTVRPFAIITDSTGPFSDYLRVSSILARDGEGLTMTPVPEPETYAMMLGGLALVGLASRRKKA